MLPLCSLLEKDELEKEDTNRVFLQLSDNPTNDKNKGRLAVLSKKTKEILLQ